VKRKEKREKSGNSFLFTLYSFYPMLHFLNANRKMALWSSKFKVQNSEARSPVQVFCDFISDVRDFIFDFRDSESASGDFESAFGDFESASGDFVPVISKIESALGDVGYFVVFFSTRNMRKNGSSGISVLPCVPR
jgi:hypothetical protein